MKPGPILAIPNFSEGRDYHFVRALQHAAEAAGVTLHTISWDVDHNRTVAGLSGDPRSLSAALENMAVVAFQTIDLRKHAGVHPRIGALDVLPLVPTQPEHTDSALQMAENMARRLAEIGDLPVFLYERSARPGRRKELPQLRKGQYEGWVGRELTGEFVPDFGPTRLHEALGATVVGVRGPLTAFNVNLAPPDPDLAQKAAREIRLQRSFNPRLLGVRAMGVRLASRGMSQVSANITDPDNTGMADVFEFVESIVGDAISWCEIVGVVREVDLDRARDSPAWSRMRLRYWPEQVLKY